MRFLYDQNLSYRLVADLEDLYPDSLHVRDIGMKESDDSDIWDYAAQNGYIIVSKDSDFHQQSGEEHHRPKGWRNFVSRLCAIDCVSQVSYDTAAFGGEVVKVIDGASGVITVRYSKSDEELPLRIETSARGIEQTELVK